MDKDIIIGIYEYIGQNVYMYFSDSREDFKAVTAQ